MNYYSMEHDSEVCIYCNEFVNTNCGAEDCEYCENRPVKPLDVSNEQELNELVSVLDADRTGNEGDKHNLMRLR